MVLSFSPFLFFALFKIMKQASFKYKVTKLIVFSTVFITIEKHALNQKGAIKVNPRKQVPRAIFPRIIKIVPF